MPVSVTETSASKEQQQDCEHFKVKHESGNITSMELLKKSSDKHTQTWVKVENVSLSDSDPVSIKKMAEDEQQQNVLPVNCDESQDMLIQTGEKSYQCNVCQKEFSQAGDLKRHMLTHTGEKPHQCNVCQKAFSLARNLRQHMLTHAGDKPHTCNVCQKAFSQG